MQRSRKLRREDGKGSMVHILLTAFNALAPVVTLIMLGYYLKRIGFLTKDFLKTGNQMVFSVCLPAMLFTSVYDIDGLQAINWSFVCYCIAMLLLIFVLGFLTSVAVTRDPRKRGVIWQCTYYSNLAIIGMSLANALGGREAVATISIVIAFAAPMFNVLGVISLSAFVSQGKEGQGRLRSVLSGILRNPQIIAAVAALLCLVIRELQTVCFGSVVFRLSEQTKFLYTTLNNVKSISTPFALLVLGGQFAFSATRGLLKEIVAGTAWKIVLSPILGTGLAVFLSLKAGLLACGVAEFSAMIAIFGSPVAVSSAVMAGAMGSDEQLATQLVVWTSVFSIATIFAQVCILMAAGILRI